jgi:hypothetical protein
MSLPYAYYSEFDKATQQINWIEIFDQISRYKQLNNGWDGEGAFAPREDVIESLLSYLRYIKDNSQLSAPVRSVVTPGGGILVEWQFEDSILELETNECGVFEFMQSPDVGDPVFFEIDGYSLDYSGDQYMTIDTTWNDISSTYPVRAAA